MNPREESLRHRKYFMQKTPKYGYNFTYVINPTASIKLKINDLICVLNNPTNWKRWPLKLTFLRDTFSGTNLVGKPKKKKLKIYISREKIVRLVLAWFIQIFSFLKTTDSSFQPPVEKFKGSHLPINCVKLDS